MPAKVVDLSTVQQALVLVSFFLKFRPIRAIMGDRDLDMQEAICESDDLGNINDELGDFCTMINHSQLVVSHLANLLFDEKTADVILLIGEARFPAHRAVLSCRSSYFHALFYGGMIESKCREVRMMENEEGMRMLLTYIYTGKMPEGPWNFDKLVMFLTLVHKYGFDMLVQAMSDCLKLAVNVQTACAILDIAQTYNLSDLKDYILVFADRNAPHILQSRGFMELSASSIEELVSRDTFFSNEVDIFQGCLQWIQADEQRGAYKGPVMSKVRLQLLSMEEILAIRPTGIYSADTLLDAVSDSNQTQNRSQLPYRFNSIPDTDLTRLNPAQSPEDCDYRELCNGSSAVTILLKLSSIYLVNHIRINLPDESGNAVSSKNFRYSVEVAVKKSSWICVADFSRIPCRSRQDVYFKQRPVQYIAIKSTCDGTYELSSKYHLRPDLIEIYYSTKSVPRLMADGIIVPKKNVATTERNALVLHGVSRTRNALINGQVDCYDWDNGYTCHQIGSGSIIIQLCQPYLVGTARMRLWDLDDRDYSYYIEVSENGEEWFLVCDRRNFRCRGWQDIVFDTERVTVFIKIVGTHNSVNEVFHCVHFECPRDPMAKAAPPESVVAR